MLFSYQGSRRARILLWVSNHQKGSRVSFSGIQKGANKIDSGSGIDLPNPPGSDHQDITCPYPSGSDVLLVQFAGASCCTDVRALFFHIANTHAQLDFVSSSRRPPSFGGLSFQGATKKKNICSYCSLYHLTRLLSRTFVPLPGNRKIKSEHEIVKCILKILNSPRQKYKFYVL